LRRLLAGWLGLVAFAVAPAFADDPGDVGSVRILQPGAPVELSADSMEYEAARDLYVARGSVLIRQAGRELRAEWMAFNNRTRRGIASGNVIYTDGTDTVHTSFVEFDVETLEGVMFDAEFDVANNRLELRGAEIAKTGERTYSFKEGEFTACRCPDPEARKPWKLTAEPGRAGGVAALDDLSAQDRAAVWAALPGLRPERPQWRRGGAAHLLGGRRPGEPGLHSALAPEARLQGRPRVPVRVR
jgi:lipopolysaccharide export system protein LptA